MTRARPLLLATLIPVLGACDRTKVVQRTLLQPTQVGTVDRRLPYLKAHLRDGHVMILSRWAVDTVGGAVVGVVTGISAAITAACLSNPKSCFGSCPTFYVGDERGRRVAAEGFSASVAPALEATDVDALYHARPAGRRLAPS